MSAHSEPSGGSVVLDAEGDAWQGYAGRWTCAHGAKRDPASISWDELNEHHGPVTTIYDRLAEEWRKIKGFAHLVDQLAAAESRLTEVRKFAELFGEVEGYLDREFVRDTLVALLDGWVPSTGPEGEQ